MKHIEVFKIFESKLEDSKKELKYFQNALDLDVTVKELMGSIDAVKLDLNSMFPTLKGTERLSDIPKDNNFVEALEKLELKISSLHDTEDLETFARMPMKWYWVSNEDASELEMPIYILYKYYHDGKWSKMNLYYVQDEITKFLDALSLVTIEIRVDNSDKDIKRWFYTTPDSGKSWNLEKEARKITENGSKKIVKSNEATGTFKEKMKWDDMLYLARNVNTKLIIY